jgi:hypothetical protein
MTEFDTVFSGGKGTGKTTALVAAMTSHIDAMLAAGRPFNAHAYTPKPDDFYPLLKERYGPRGVSVRATNPFIGDSWAWDGAADLTTPPQVEQLATTAIRDDGRDHNPFFKKAAQLLLRGVVQSLGTTHPGLWTMRHVAACLRDMRHLTRVLARCEHTAHLVTLLSAEQGTTAANLLGTLLAELKGLELVASLIDEAPDHRRFSVVEAANEPGIIWVWGSDPRYDATIEPWNAVQLELIGHELLIRGRADVETLLYIDEFPQLSAGGGQKLTIIRKLLEFGRSARVRSTLAEQTPAQVAAVYGQEDATTLLGQCHNAVVFKHSDDYGQAYWSKRLGRERGFERKRTFSGQVGGSETRGSQPSWGTSWAVTEGVNIERFDLERVTPSEIGDLPVGTYEFGLFGYAMLPLSLHLDPATGFPQPIKWRFHLTPEWIARHVPRPGDFTPYARGHRPGATYTMRPLEDWEYGLLGLDRPQST